MSNAHYIGQGRFLEEGGASSPTSGTSLAVSQWVELVRGERPIQAPANPFQVESVTCEEQYCLRCCGLRHFDVVHAVTNKLPVWDWDLGMDVRFVMKRCRACGNYAVE